VLVSSLIDYNFEYFVRTNSTFVIKLRVGCWFVINIKYFRGTYKDTFFVEI
jgi:hypothetical protein